MKRNEDDDFNFNRMTWEQRDKAMEGFATYVKHSIKWKVFCPIKECISGSNTPKYYDRLYEAVNEVVIHVGLYGHRTQIEEVTIQDEN